MSRLNKNSNATVTQLETYTRVSSEKSNKSDYQTFPSLAIPFKCQCFLSISLFSRGQCTSEVNCFLILPTIITLIMQQTSAAGLRTKDRCRMKDYHLICPQSHSCMRSTKSDPFDLHCTVILRLWLDLGSTGCK